MKSGNKRIIGFWGYPDINLIQRYKELYPSHEWVDLDIDYGYPQLSIIPESSCKIVKNMLYNAIHLKDQLEAQVYFLSSIHHHNTC